MAKADDKILATGMVEVQVTNLIEEENDEGEETKKTFTSEVQTIGGMTWRIEAHKVVVDKNDPPDICLFVFCNEDVRDRLWLCKVFFKVYSEVLGVPTTRHKFNSRQFYCFNSFNWVLVVDFDPKLYHKVTMNIILEIEIHWMAQNNNLSPLDTNLAIKMDDGSVEVLPVNKHILAGYSTYFRNLFFGPWKEREEVGNKNEEEGNDVDNAAVAEYFEIWEDDEFSLNLFKFMIYGAFTMGSAVRESNHMKNYELAVALVKLSTKYDMRLMVDYAEELLLSNDEEDDSQMEKLDLAEQFNLKKFKDLCIEKVDPLDFVVNIDVNMGICLRLSDGTRELLYENLKNKGEECQNRLSAEKE